MDLLQELERFSETLPRNGETAKFIGSAAETNKDDLQVFYDSLEFDGYLTIVSLAFNLFPKNKLQQLQRGWADISNKNIEMGNSDFMQNDWIAFGEVNDDAVFFDKNGNSVIGTVDGSQFYTLATSLAKFIFFLTEVMILSRKFNFETRDENEEPLEKFVSSVRDIALENDAVDVADDIVSFFFD